MIWQNARSDVLKSRCFEKLQLSGKKKSYLNSTHSVTLHTFMIYFLCQKRGFYFGRSLIFMKI